MNRGPDPRSTAPALTRRSLVGLGGVCLLGGVAGCSALTSGSATLDLVVFNHADATYRVGVTLLRPDHDGSLSAARSYERTLELDPNGEARREGVAQSRRYLVRYDVVEMDEGRQTDQDHVHYYPRGGDDTITFDLHPPGELTVRWL